MPIKVDLHRPNTNVESVATLGVHVCDHHPAPCPSCDFRLVDSPLHPNLATSQSAYSLELHIAIGQFTAGSAPSLCYCFDIDLHLLCIRREILEVINYTPSFWGIIESYYTLRHSTCLNGDFCLEYFMRRLQICRLAYQLPAVTMP